MREMKDSGETWIGEIPEAWRLEILKNSLKQINEPNSPIKTTSVLSLTNKLGVVPFEEKGDQGNKAKENYEEYKLAYPNTLVVNSMNVLIGSVGISRFFGCVSPVYYVFHEVEGKSDLRFVNYVFQIPGFQKELRRYANGILEIRLRISSYDLLHRPIPFPPLYEQSRISDFLDVKCAEIDTILENTRASIEEYKKLKQSVITEAVTKGICGERPMKDSGVEWIGEIPAEWRISRVGLHFSIILGKMLCSEQLDESYSLEKYFCAADVHFSGVSYDGLKKMWFSPTEKTLYKVFNGDLLVVEGGAGAGGAAVASGVIEDIFIQNSIMIVRPMAHNSVTYLKYLLESLVGRGYVDFACNKATIPHFTKDKLGQVPFPLPSTVEQKEIAAYLDEKCAAIDGLIASKESLITELETYKKSIIYEYVTGKKEVPAV